MADFEYKTVLAPKRAKRVKGIKGKDAQYAATLADALNREAQGGWEFVRAEHMPVEEKKGLMGKLIQRTYTLLVFRRMREGLVHPHSVPFADSPSRRSTRLVATEGVPD